MKAITLLQPQKIVFGTGCIQSFVDDYKKMGLQRLFVLTAPPIRPLIEEPLSELEAAGIKVMVYQDIVAEPTVNDFMKVLAEARQFKADSVAGIGGGSVLDVTKLIAAFINSDQQVEDCFGTGFIRQKGLWFACAHDGRDRLGSIAQRHPLRRARPSEEGHRLAPPDCRCCLC